MPWKEKLSTRYYPPVERKIIHPAGDKEKWKSETSSSLLVTAETIGRSKVMICEDYSNL